MAQAQGAPRPDERPPAPRQSESLPIHMRAGFEFFSASAQARADFSNEAGQGWMLYAVQIDRAELMRRAGVEIADEAFTCFDSGRLGPGEGREAVRLNRLADGSALPAGQYACVVRVLSYPSAGAQIADYEFVVPSTLYVRCDARTASGALAVHNGLDEGARFAVVASRSAIAQGSGAPDAPMPGLDPRYAYVLLGEYQSLSAGQSAEIPLKALPAGTYDAWLIRYPQGAPDAPYALSRLTLEGADGDASALLQEAPQMDLALAQAIVNGEYYLAQADSF